jgi:methane monooxygenase PmoA-like
MKNSCVFLQFAFISLATVYSLPAAVTVEKSEHGATVKIDGQPFTEYRTQAGHEPALYPVIGPTDKPVTRSYPFTSPGDTDDHPHHQSFWMTHGDVNGIDFWGTNRNDNKGDTGPHIKHREFVKVANEGETAEIVTRNDWMKGDERICEDERKLVFGNGPDDSRWIDCKITITATDGDVKFGDTKEGSFAIRVADSMRVDAKTGGKIVNSENQTDGASWGQPARWVDYTGPVEGETVGIAILSHPKSFVPAPRWHVRTYGLFAANPFGKKDFPNPDSAEQGPLTLKKGDSITLRYRVILHKGTTDTMSLERAFKEFAGR